MKKEAGRGVIRRMVDDIEVEEMGWNSDTLCFEESWSLGKESEGHSMTQLQKVVGRRFASMEDGRLDFSKWLGFRQGNPTDAVRLALNETEKCTKVLPFLYMGGEAAAACQATVHDCGITHIVGLSRRRRLPWGDGRVLSVARTSFEVRDHVDEDVMAVLYDSCDVIEAARSCRGACLVHCRYGISRSPSIVIGYLMVREGLRFAEAFDFVRRLRPIIDPNTGFLLALRSLDEWIFSPTQSPRVHVLALRTRDQDIGYLAPKCVSVSSMEREVSSASTLIVEGLDRILLWSGPSVFGETHRRGLEVGRQLQRYNPVRRLALVTIHACPENLEILRQAMEPLSA